MKAFKYRMQTKLDIASLEEQMAKEELLLRSRERDRIQEELDDIIKRQLELEQSLVLLILEGFSMDEFMIHRDYVPVLREFRLDKETDLARAERNFEKARLILVEKTRETQTLKKLREKEWNAYLQEVLREEQKVIDEVAINRHYRKNLS